MDKPYIPPMEPPLPPEEWVLAEKAMEYAWLSRGEETMMANMVSHGDDGGIEVHAFAEFDEDVKAAAMMLIRQKRPFSPVVFTTEVWMAAYNASDYEAFGGPRPSEHPDREEDVLVILYSEKGYNVMWRLPIVNNAVCNEWELVGDERVGWVMGGRLSAKDKGDFPGNFNFE